MASVTHLLTQWNKATISHIDSQKQHKILLLSSSGMKRGFCSIFVQLFFDTHSTFSSLQVTSSQLCQCRPWLKLYESTYTFRVSIDNPMPCNFDLGDVRVEASYTVQEGNQGAGVMIFLKCIYRIVGDIKFYFFFCKSLSPLREALRRRKTLWLPGPMYILYFHQEGKRLASISRLQESLPWRLACVLKHSLA